MGFFLEVKLVGGLGNQLFQYATGRSICKKKNIPYLLLNLESYANDPFGRKPTILHYNLKARTIENGFIKKLLRKDTKLNRLISAFPFYHTIEEDGLRLHKFSDESHLITSITGYWQSEQYFKDIRSSLLEELTPKNMPELPKWVANKNSVAVHIRRTDYLTESKFGFLGEKYYHEAMDKMQQQLKDPLFIFFSDDIDWCKNTFGHINNVLFETSKEWEADYLQLFLMSKCSHQIIANSSFSWWSGWLNNNPEKLVIKPAQPFADKSMMYESYYPSEWATVENFH
jgi:hypothetical protein